MKFFILNIKPTKSHYLNYNFEQIFKAVYLQKFISQNFLKPLIHKNLSTQNIWSFLYAKMDPLKT